MNSDIMIDVVKKVFSTYQSGDMGLDLGDVIKDYYLESFLYK